MHTAHTEWLLATSAGLLFVMGVALSFAPHEVLGMAGQVPGRALVLLAQITGALALGWAMLNWMSRRQRVGGIYNRPLALANFLHFTMVALSIVRLVPAGDSGSLEHALLVPYVALAVWWGVAMFTSPV
jgi:hypothetical protein